jgi:hypothetical protein
MSFFIFPQSWIAPAITAAAISFGPVENNQGEEVSPIRIKYRDLDGLSSRKPPDKILIDKLPKREWPREKAQCVIVFQYARLAGVPESENPKSIMYPTLRYKICHRWLVRHGIK